MDEKDAVKALLELMARLRDPEDGCPWDLEQDFSTIAPYTIEEAYEVADAIERNDMYDLKDELGDLLLQVVFHSQIAKEKGLFDFMEVARHVTEKMVHRHPHVFGEEKAANARDVEGRIWEERKAQEGKKQALDSILDDVPRNFPALLRARKLQKRAARVGFEWEQPAHVLDKLEEETREMREALANNKHGDKHGDRHDDILDELGDLLFVLVNFGRMLDINAEEALRHANNKFESRFRGIENDFKLKNKKLEDATLDEMEESWQAQKAKERSAA